MGAIEFGETSVSFKEDQRHSWEWKYQDIQQMTLRPAELRILTYEDQKWKLGLDREFRFDRLPEGFGAQVYALLRGRLDQRFAADLDDPEVQPLWQIGAKLHQGRSGTQGLLLIGPDRIVYKTAKGDSHTWRYTDIDNLSSSGSFDLSITTLERSAWHHGSPTEYHFQLKEELREGRYNDLWRRLNRTKGLGIFSSE